MSSIIGHGLVGVISKQCIKTSLPREKENRLLALSIFLAILPDFDVIVFLMLKPAGMTPHRGISHSLVFITMTALFFGIAAFRYFPISKRRLFFICFCPLLSHLFLDYLMGAGPPVPFFAPVISRGFLSPIKLVPCAYYSTSVTGLVGLLTHAPTLIGIVMELLIFVPMIIFLGISGDDGKERWIKAGSLVFSILALLITCYLYNFCHGCLSD